MTDGDDEDRSILGRPVPTADECLAYGALPDQVADVWRARGTARGLVVMLHGGFWEQKYDRSHLRPMAAALRDESWDVVLPEYRRVGGAGGWPQTFEDVELAVRVLAAGRGASAMTLLGHSAGGHLALWLAASQSPGTLAGVVGLAPVAELAVAARLGLGDGAVERLMGGGPEGVPERYAAGDPAHLPTPSCPVRLIHGSADTLVPASMSVSYANGRDTVRVSLVGGGHFELIDPERDQFATVTRSLDELAL